MKTKILTRILDGVMIAILLFGSQDAKTFAFWMISIMVAMLFLGWLAVDRALAEKIRGRSSLSVAFGLALHAVYVAALIWAGFPILAALYATAASLIRLRCEAKLKETEVAA